MDMTLDKSFGAGQTSFAITGGGALFQLGPQVTSNQQVNIGIQSVAASKLGDQRRRVPQRPGHRRQQLAGRAATPPPASQIIEQAISQVAVLRGRLGAFEKNTLDTNVNSLNVALENVTASESTSATPTSPPRPPP